MTFCQSARIEKKMFKKDDVTYIPKILITIWPSVGWFSSPHIPQTPWEVKYTLWYNPSTILA